MAMYRYIIGFHFVEDLLGSAAPTRNNQDPKQKDSVRYTPIATNGHKNARRSRPRRAASAPFSGGMFSQCHTRGAVQRRNIRETAHRLFWQPKHSFALNDYPTTCVAVAVSTDVLAPMNQGADRKHPHPCFVTCLLATARSGRRARAQAVPALRTQSAKPTSQCRLRPFRCTPHLQSETSMPSSIPSSIARALRS